MDHKLVKLLREKGYDLAAVTKNTIDITIMEEVNQLAIRIKVVLLNGKWVANTVFKK
jgi:hydroxymethylpyrimidine pyrophosphatase-like HAD family hydrolase